MSSYISLIRYYLNRYYYGFTLLVPILIDFKNLFNSLLTKFVVRKFIFYAKCFEIIIWFIYRIFIVNIYTEVLYILFIRDGSMYLF